MFKKGNNYFWYLILAIMIGAYCLFTYAPPKNDNIARDSIGIVISKSEKTDKTEGVVVHNIKEDNMQYWDGAKWQPVTQDNGDTILYSNSTIGF